MAICAFSGGHVDLFQHITSYGKDIPRVITMCLFASYNEYISPNTTTERRAKMLGIYQTCCSLVDKHKIGIAYTPV